MIPHKTTHFLLVVEPSVPDFNGLGFGEIRSGPDLQIGIMLLWALPDVAELK